MRWDKFAIFCGAMVTIGAVASGIRHTGSQAFADTSSAPRSFSSVTENESAVLDYKSSGCYHTRHLRFTYSASPTPQVNVVKISGDAKTPPAPLGTVTLTPAQLARLDNVLAYYRGVKGGGCTTVETVAFTVFRDGEKTHRESYVDRTCGRLIPGENKLPMLSLQRLVEFSEQSQSSGQPVAYRDSL